MRLLESSHAPRRDRAGTLVSIAIHVAVIGGALVATAHAHDALVDERPTATRIYFAPPPPPPPADATSRPSTASHGAAPPTVPSVPPSAPVGPIPPIDIPSTIPAPGRDPVDDIARTFDRGLGAGDRSGVSSGPAAGEPYTEHLVERAAVPLAPARPRYPEMLRAANVEGGATLRFVVDTLGRVEPGSARVVAATHPQFGDAALASIASLRFRPAEAAGHRVRQLVELPFEFRLAR